MDLGVLVAQVDHGPGAGMAVVHVALVAIIVVGGLAFVLLRNGRKGADRQQGSVSDRDPEPDRRRDA